MIAIFIALLKCNGNTRVSIIVLKGLIKIEKIATVIMLKNKLKCASFFESFSALNIP